MWSVSGHQCWHVCLHVCANKSLIFRVSTTWSHTINKRQKQTALRWSFTNVRMYCSRCCSLCWLSLYTLLLYIRNIYIAIISCLPDIVWFHGSCSLTVNRVKFNLFVCCCPNFKYLLLIFWRCKAAWIRIEKKIH